MISTNKETGRKSQVQIRRLGNPEPGTVNANAIICNI